MKAIVSLSVVIPVFNASRYLRTALDSLQAQTYRSFEVIAVDDGSTDGSLRILQEYARRDARFRVISRPNTGIVGALNDGLAQCQGEFVARMDADDVSMPERFATQTSFLIANPGCVAVGAAVLFTDPEGRPLKEYLPLQAHDEIVSELANGNGGALVHGAGIYRRKALLAVGGYREQFQWIEDLDLFVRLCEMGQMRNLPEVLLRYRQHPKSVNHTKGDRREQRAKIVSPLRVQLGLEPLTADDLRRENPAVCVADYRRIYALDAAEAGNLDSAKANAWLAVRMKPLDRRNWSCFRYVRSLHKRADRAESRIAEVVSL